MSNKMPQYRLPGVPERFGGVGNFAFVLLAGAPTALACVVGASTLLMTIGATQQTVEDWAREILGLSAAIGIGAAWYFLRWLHAHRISRLVGCVLVAVGLPLSLLAVFTLMAWLGWWLAVPLVAIAGVIGLLRLRSSAAS